MHGSGSSWSWRLFQRPAKFLNSADRLDCFSGGSSTSSCNASSLPWLANGKRCGMVAVILHPFTVRGTAILCMLPQPIRGPETRRSCYRCSVTIRRLVLHSMHEAIGMSCKAVWIESRRWVRRERVERGLSLIWVVTLHAPLL